MPTAVHIQDLRFRWNAAQMVYKLAGQAEKHWRRLKAHQLILTLLQGGQFEDGMLKKAA